MQLPSQVEDYHKTILRFLIHMTGNLTRNQTRDDTTDIEMEEVVQTADEDSDATDDSGYHTATEESKSTLSSWTDDSKDRPTTPIDLSDDHADIECPNWAAYFLPTVEDVDGKIEKEIETERSLLHRLAKVQLSEIPLSVCSLLLRSEAEVALCSLKVLQGRASSVFIWNQHSRQFLIDVQLQTLDHSAMAMRDALSWFACSGSRARSVHDWSVEILDAGGKGEMGYGRPSVMGICPTLLAVAQAMQAQLQSILTPLIQLEARLDTDHRLHPTVIQMRCLCGPAARRLHTLNVISLQIQELQNEEKSQKQMTCQILDILHRRSTEDDLLHSPEFRKDVEVVWSLFVASLAPLLSHLTAWLYLGDLSTISEDFFIAPLPARNSEEADFWLDAFPMNEDRCPGFLKEVMSVVHDGGKALQLTRRQAYGGHRLDDMGKHGTVHAGRLEALVRDDWTGNLLHRQFTDYLLRSASEGLSIEHGSMNGTSIADKMAAAGSYDGSTASEFLVTSSVPWSYINEDDPPLQRTITLPLPPPAADIVEVVQNVPMEEESEMVDMPPSYLKTKAAIENMKAEMEGIFNRQPHSQMSVCIS